MNGGGGRETTAQCTLEKKGSVKCGLRIKCKKKQKDLEMAVMKRGREP